MTIGLIDYGAGNFDSVRNALSRINADYCAVQDVRDFDKCDRLLLPGVGAGSTAMARLDEKGFVEAIVADVQERGKPILGICVGMQLLGSTGHEFETFEGLGLVPGETVPIEAPGLRLPHIGWNEVKAREGSKLFAGLGERPCFYFLHSFQLAPRAAAAVAGRCDYGNDIVAAIEVEQIFGTQFHPEKSQHDGLRVLHNFAKVRP